MSSRPTSPPPPRRSPSLPHPRPRPPRLVPPPSRRYRPPRSSACPGEGSRSRRRLGKTWRPGCASARLKLAEAHNALPSPLDLPPMARLNGAVVATRRRLFALAFLLLPTALCLGLLRVREAYTGSHFFHFL